VKTEWHCVEAKLLVWKSEHGFPRGIFPEDVIPIMNWIFFKVGGNEKNNCKATAENDCFPPNRKLLEHPWLVSP